MAYATKDGFCMGDIWNLAIPHLIPQAGNFGLGELPFAKDFRHTNVAGTDSAVPRIGHRKEQAMGRKAAAAAGCRAVWKATAAITFAALFAAAITFVMGGVLPICGGQ